MAVQRVRIAARTAAERAIDSLALASLAATNAYHRDSLLEAQFELHRKLAIFALTFNETLDAAVAEELGHKAAAPRKAMAAEATTTDWASLALVDDHEVEISINADRFALEIAHACEWEIRELDGYIGSLLGQTPGQSLRNPLRAQTVGEALIRAVEAIADRTETRKVLQTEIGRALAQAMRQTYAEITSGLRDSGIRPIGLTVLQAARASAGRSGGARTENGDSGMPTESGVRLRRSGAPAGDVAGRDWSPSGPGSWGGGSAWGGLRAGGGDDGLVGHIDPAMISVIRRLQQGPGAAASYAAPWDGDETVAAPNLIQTHRAELQRAARSNLDQFVIDVIATLFDQILSDPKLAPQVARLIARLQLPVLRAALGDGSFFSTRRHPVRRLVNRIASLGAAFDDPESPEARSLIERMCKLVDEIIEGDFEHFEVYERTLDSLDALVAEQARERLDAEGETGTLLARKEAQLRVEQRFAVELDGALAALPIPDYLRDFLAKVWSRAIASAEHEHGHDSALAHRIREVGHELVLSVQPKGGAAQRKAFLQRLPQLMKDLNRGMDRVQWPDEARREFFAQLLPAHAESLKGQPISTLEQNLLARKAESALATPMPAAETLPSGGAAAMATLETPEVPVVFTPAEAQAVGLVQESHVDWNSTVDIDVGGEPELAAADLGIEGLPAPDPAEADEPTAGKSLADHVQIGFAYRMHLEGQWRKVRLAHVSEGRTFFVFKHGAKQRETISMTHRMLLRLCESGRLRAFESAHLIERATARARRQLAAMGRRAPAPAAAAAR